MYRKKYLSVIIPTYNRRNYIVDAVKSVLIQDIDNIEIIVVDDGSIDGTQDVLKPYIRAIRYIYQKNQGVSAARNRGIRESRGELIAFLDSDDIWLPGKLKTQIDQVSSIEVLSFEGVEWFVDREEDMIMLSQCRSVKWPRCNSRGYVIDPVLDVAEGAYLHLGTLLCRKDSFLNVGFFDERLCMGEDEDWFSRASLQLQFHYTHKPLLRRRLHVTQTVTGNYDSISSLLRVFSNMKDRTRGIHPKAYAVVNQRMAAKWSHLANNMAYHGHRLEACHAAWSAFFLEPTHIKRLMKIGLILLGWRPDTKSVLKTPV